MYESNGGGPLDELGTIDNWLLTSAFTKEIVLKEADQNQLPDDIALDKEFFLPGSNCPLCAVEGGVCVTCHMRWLEKKARFFALLDAKGDDGSDGGDNDDDADGDDNDNGGDGGIKRPGEGVGVDPT